jgi:hypothetical protein
VTFLLCATGGGDILSSPTDGYDEPGPGQLAIRFPQEEAGDRSHFLVLLVSAVSGKHVSMV